MSNKLLIAVPDTWATLKFAHYGQSHSCIEQSDAELDSSLTAFGTDVLVLSLPHNFLGPYFGDPNFLPHAIAHPYGKSFKCRSQYSHVSDQPTLAHPWDSFRLFPVY